VGSRILDFISPNFWMELSAKIQIIKLAKKEIFKLALCHNAPNFL